GTSGFTHAGSLGDAVAVGPTGYVLGRALNGTVTVTKWPFRLSRPEWQDTWQNSASISVMALGPSGQVYFSGGFTGPISFGGPVVTPRDGSSVFLAALSSSGGHVFTRDIDRGPPRSLASNGRVIAMSRLISPRGPRLRIFDAQGQDILGESGQTGFGGSGNTGSVAVGPSDRVYWNFAEAWPSASSPAYPYLIALDPGV
ncbi:MAG TPA: hypothetical protein VFT22_35880, partial [Kofleriaceae bacterium]|nr:hypothetical protein [Kofleriaceae bacterium]